MLFAILIIALTLTACSQATLSSSEGEVTQTPDTRALAPPDSQEPAAGICSTVSTVGVLIQLDPDISAPRCVKVRPNQKLSIYNNTQKTLEVSFAGILQTELAPGVKTSIDTPFGEYLAPGVHQIKVSPCCGAEIWLEDK
jgi:PBP1b-binding outer membrane lipoprotein LpoB